ncbi:cytochrome b [Acidisoma sp. 7E03]
MPDAFDHETMPTHRTDLEGHYDSLTITLHWLTASLVVSLFALAELWSFVPRGEVRETMEGLHVSLGCLLVVVVVTRVLWRSVGGRRLPQPGHRHLVHAGHGLLYLLLLTMIVTGPLKRWTSDHPLNFFWVASIPSPMAVDRPLHVAVTIVHFWAAWAIIAVAGGHALIALYHHYGRGDGVLGRMIPWIRPRDQRRRA